MSGLRRGRRVGKGSPVRQRVTQVLNPADGQHKGAGTTYSFGGVGGLCRGESAGGGRQPWEVLPRRLVYAGLDRVWRRRTRSFGAGCWAGFEHPSC